tara:strand:- start:107 stop:412 length:306 start_codon:yes stop_codon:yes gene_type:complete
MPKKCDSTYCVSKKKYDNLLVEHRALKEKIAALEMGKLPVQKFSSSEEYDSSDFDSIEDTGLGNIPASGSMSKRGGNKKGKKGKKGKKTKGRKGKTRRMRG